MQRRVFLQYLPACITVPSLLAVFERPYRQTIDDADAAICAEKFEIAISGALQKKPIGEIIVEIGKSFLGTEYLAFALEMPGEEHLVVNMRGLDCVSFCENALVFARCIKKNAMTFDDYKRELQFVRYRSGAIDRYPSRLHYFTDYIYDGEKKGIWRDVTKLLGGKPYRKTINFMSTHPQAYRQLKENPEFVKEIQQQEAEIGKREMSFIEKSDIAAMGQNIRNGDILAITTDIEGLDVSHTGVAVRKNRRLHMMHAPDVGSTVMITELPLVDYLAKNKRQTGIIIARALEPKS